MAPKHELLKGSANSLLLCLLENQAMYGYQIAKVLEARSQGYFTFKEGTLYPALHRLEKSGLIAGSWEKLPNGRRRRYYSLTAKGHTTLVEERSRWNEFLAAVRMILHPGGVQP